MLEGKVPEDSMPPIEIQETALVVATGGGRDGAGAFLRRAVPEAVHVSMVPWRIGFSDDPSSPEAMRGAYECVRREVERALRAGRSVTVDAAGLRDDQVNSVRKMCVLGHVPGLRLDLPADPSALEVVRVPSPTDRRQDRGPFDVVGDVHGCLDELVELLEALGYDVRGGAREEDGQRRFSVSHPAGRRIAFVGDLADRGPDSVGCLALAMDAVESGDAIWTPGNHDATLEQWLRDGKASRNHGFDVTAAEMAGEPAVFRGRLLALLGGLPSHQLLDGGDLVVAHAGCLGEMQGRDSGKVMSFCLYGATTGEKDAHGYPVRADWAADYVGRAFVVHGHTPEPAPRAGRHGNVLCIDTGCVFGGSLTALRWPERELVSVPARRAYYPHAAFQAASGAPAP